LQRILQIKKYGITPDEYDVMFAKQEGKCAAGKQAETHRNQFGIVSLAVDHDHLTGDVRGLLCGRCNRSLGLLQDSVRNIQGLLEYRSKFKKRGEAL